MFTRNNIKPLIIALIIILLFCGGVLGWKIQQVRQDKKLAAALTEQAKSGQSLDKQYDLLLRAWSHDKENQEISRELADTCFKLSQQPDITDEQRKDYLKKAVQMDRRNTSYSMALGWEYEISQQTSEAIQCYEQAAAYASTNENKLRALQELESIYYGQGLGELRQAYSNSGNIENALALFNKAGETYPKSIRSHLTLFEIYSNQGLMNKASQELKWLKEHAKKEVNYRPLELYLSYWENQKPDTMSIKLSAGNISHLDFYSLSWSNTSSKLLLRIPDENDKANYFLVDASNRKSIPLGSYAANHCKMLWTPDDSQIIVAARDKVLVMSSHNGEIVDSWQQQEIISWALSTDGKQLAFSDNKGLWICTIDGKNKKIIHKTTGKNDSIRVPIASAWNSEDNKILFYYGLWEGSQGLYEIDLATSMVNTVHDVTDISSTAYSPDGKKVCWSEYTYGGEDDGGNQGDGSRGIEILTQA